MNQMIVKQLRFAKQKWLEGHAGLTAEDAAKRLGQANCISWMVGHLAHFDQVVWLEAAQGKTVNAAVKVCDWGQPASAPDLEEMLAAWREITAEVDQFLDTLTEADLASPLKREGQRLKDPIGNILLRQTWHYWYHLGEMQAIRQALGHTELPQYVGRMPPDIAFSASH